MKRDFSLRGERETRSKPQFPHQFEPKKLGTKKSGAGAGLTSRQTLFVAGLWAGPPPGSPISCRRLYTRGI